MNMQAPCPILDAKELKHLEALGEQYRKITTPNLVDKAFSSAAESVQGILPDSVKDAITASTKLVSEADLMKQCLEFAGSGYSHLCKLIASHTLSKDAAVSLLRGADKELDSFDRICALRGYKVEQILGKAQIIDRVAATANGAAGGALGVTMYPVLAVSLCASMLLLYRAVQGTALTYGYDISEPGELAFASEVTTFSMAPKATTGTFANTWLGKAMLVADMAALGQLLAKDATLKTIASAGGSALFYVQVRALSSSAAKKALQEAGQTGLEQTLFKKILKEAGKGLTKEAAAKAVPLFSAAIGALFDFNWMHQVLTNANIVYHKRFLLEKEKRVALAFPN